MFCGIQPGILYTARKGRPACGINNTLISTPGQWLEELSQEGHKFKSTEDFKQDPDPTSSFDLSVSNICRETFFFLQELKLWYLLDMY